MKDLLLLKPNAPSLEFSGQSILYGLFAVLTDERRLSPPTKDIYREGYVFKAISYIEQHYTDPSLHLSQISRHLNISSSYLSAVFKSQTGQTVMNYIISMRMAKACQMLEEGHNTIQNISSLVGFSDSHYFSKFFKKYVGISPSKYKAHVNTQT